MSRFSLAILLLLVASGAVLFGAKPQWEAIKSARADIEKFQSLHKELSELALSRDALTREYNSLAESDLEKLASIAPEAPNTGKVLTDFEIMSQKNGLRLDGVEFLKTSSAALAVAPPSETLGYETIPVSMALKGGYENLREFLKALESNLRLVDVDEINFSTTESRDLTITVKGKIYYR